MGQVKNKPEFDHLFYGQNLLTYIRTVQYINSTSQKVLTINTIYTMLVHCLLEKMVHQEINHVEKMAHY